MIGQLRGKLLEKQPPELLLDVQGVGYELLAPMTTFYRLPDLGAEVTLFTHLSVSETAQQLYGFIERRDRALFRNLIKVNGVGPKLAVAILSGMDADAFVRCVHEGNSTALVKLPGVGRKTAERLLIEMRDRLKDWAGATTTDTVVTTTAPGSDQSGEAEHALIALGYKPTEASRMISAALRQQPGASSEELIRLALRSAAQ